MWFEQLTGFKEESPKDVREKIKVDGDTLLSTVNGKKYKIGSLQIPTLLELKNISNPIKLYDNRIVVSEVVANVKDLHCDSENANSIFQAASQFNLLEMIGPHITPENGIDKYELDYTQGPSCAIACGAGTIYRNYFVKIEDQLGQTFDKQIDCLDLIGKYLKNNELNLWTMKNGYALINREGILNINKMLSQFSNSEFEILKNKLKVGVQWNTEVTISSNKQKVSQVYCSALPVAYSDMEPIYWEKFARIILEATYEATMYAGLINLKKTGSNRIFLTLVGAGAFGNELSWIIESLQKVIIKFQNCPLDVRLVSFRNSNPKLRKLLNS